MVKEILVELPVEAGWNLLPQMDKAGLEITAAYWRYSDDHEAWWLEFASPLVSTKGPLYLLKEVQRLLGEMPAEERGSLELADISFVNLRDSYLRDLRRRRGPINDERYKQSSPREVDRFNPYIYRLN